MLERGKRNAGNTSLIQRLELFESLWPMLPSKLESKSIDNPIVRSKENEAIGHLAYSLDIKSTAQDARADHILDHAESVPRTTVTRGFPKL